MIVNSNCAITSCQLDKGYTITSNMHLNLYLRNASFHEINI